MNVLTEWLDQHFDEIEPREFYRNIFPLGELDKAGEYTEHKYTGILIEVTKDKKNNGQPKIKRYTVTDDLNAIDEALKTENFCIMSPLSYAGKKRSSENARFAYAIAFDVDGLRIKENGRPIGLMNLWNGHIGRVKRLPKPTMIVSSGTGLHLYYVFEKPIPLFENIAKQLQQFKHRMTEMIWNEGIVNIKSDADIQQEGIYQGFRLPGTITKQGDRAKAFLTGEKVTMEYLNSFVEEKYKVKEFTYKSSLTLSEAAKKYPEWYNRRIINGENKGRWTVKRDLYDWWIRQIYSGAKVGHRYYCIMCLAIYAKKCGIERDELEKDAFELMDFLEEMTESEDNHFEVSDVVEALEAYEDRFVTFPRNSIEYKSGIQIPANKRNGRKQKDHILLMNMMKNLKKQLGEKMQEGRPSAELMVREWQEEHPNGSKAECIRQTKLSKPTVYKWWK